MFRDKGFGGEPGGQGEAKENGTSSRPREQGYSKEISCKQGTAFHEGTPDR